MNKFNIKRIVNVLLGGLSERSKDVISSRFGIGKNDYETLEAIGQRYGITRERVRQVEADALGRIKTPAKELVLKPVGQALADFIEARGGVVEENTLVADFAGDFFDTKPEAVEQYRGAVNLLLYLDSAFKHLGEGGNFRPRWYLDAKAVRSQESVCANVAAHFKKSKLTLGFDGLLEVARADSSNLNRNILSSYLTPSKNIGANIFGEWGLAEWPEIKPRGVRDKAFLVIKRHGQPLHFTQVAGHINQARFSSRVALAKTVHNELIKDNRFVLVGRGLYALKSWGYEAGTVKDVIKSVLAKNGPMGRDAVVQAVLAKRMVKPSTVMLNLNSFKKRQDNKYTLV